MNSKKLSQTFKPKYSSQSALWKEFLVSLRMEYCLWYPSAGQDFRDLLYMHPDYFGDKDYAPTSYPEFYIHTDCNPSPDANFFENKILFSSETTEVECLEKIELIANHHINLLDSQYYDFMPSKDLNGKMFLMKLKIHSHKFGSFERYLIYVFSENMKFFKELVLKVGLRIHTIMNVVDGHRMGGNLFNLRGLELYLGLMETEYLISDNFPNGFDFSLINNDSVLKKHLQNPNNTKTLLQHFGVIMQRRYGPVTFTKIIHEKDYWQKKTEQLRNAKVKDFNYSTTQH